MASSIRKICKIFALPFVIGLWLVGWSLYSTGDNAQTSLTKREKQTSWYNEVYGNEQTDTQKRKLTKH